MRVVTLRDAVGDGQPLFIDFVNTLHWHEGLPVELIGNQADLAAWLAERELPSIDSDSGLEGLLELRKHARAATEALVHGQPLATDDLAALGDALASPSVTVVLLEPDSPRPQMAFAVHGQDAQLAAFRIALSFANFLESGNRGRLKLCANEGCGFAFVDTSTNGTRRWCYMRYCGNRLKARAFRRRHTPAPLAE